MVDTYVCKEPLMTVENVSRRAGPFTGDGSTRSFPFEFKVFASSNLVVYVSEADENAVAMALTMGDDYTVSLNSDQDENPGGTVTLTGALEDGHRLAVISDIAADQQVKITNYDRFYPTTFNDEFDKLTILVQQLVEQVSRALITDPTDSITPRQLRDKLLTAVDEAIQAASSASQSLVDARKLLLEIIDAKDGVVAAVKAEGDTQDQRLIDEGDTQVARIQAETDNTLIANGAGCGEYVWTLTDAISAGTDITIPSGLQYFVGRHHLRVAWNGIVLAINRNFVEVGETDTKSSTFRLTFDVAADDEIGVWVGALGKGDFSSQEEIMQSIEAVSDAVAELSRKVVYKSEEAAGS